MATLYVTEFSGLGGGRNDDVQAVAGPPLAEQAIAIAGAHGESAAFNAQTSIVRIQPDAFCSVTVGGATPVATTSSARMVPGQTEYYRVSPGDKVSVIANV